MELNRVERAIDGLTDLLIYLRERGDTSEALGPKADARRRHRGEKAHGKYASGLYTGGQETVRARLSTRSWERAQLKRWARAGRLTSDGTLRTSPAPVGPWTLPRVRRCLPHLKTWDAFAALIHLDGVVKENFMEAHRNIRLTLEEMIDHALERKLADKLGAIFGRILEEVKADAPIPEPGVLSGRRGQRTCSKCSKLGHTAKTCGKDAAPPADDADVAGDPSPVP